MHHKISNNWGKKPYKLHLVMEVYIKQGPTSKEKGIHVKVRVVIST